MSDERRVAPAPGSLESASTVSDPEAASSLAPNVVALATPPAADLGARRRTRQALRIPDDEVARPQADPDVPPVDPSLTPASADGDVALKPTRIITINPPATPEPSAIGLDPPASDDLDDEPAIPLVSRAQRSMPSPLPVPRSRTPSVPAVPRLLAPSLPGAPRAATSAVSPVEVAQAQSLPAQRPVEAASPPVQRAPSPSPVPTPPAAPPSFAAPAPVGARGDARAMVNDGELSLDDLIDSAPALAEPRASPPAVRARLPSHPAVPTGKKPAPTPARRPSKPPLVFVPPHMGSVSPQQPEGGSAHRRKGRFWWEELFNDDYLRAAERITEEQLAREVDFIEESLGVERGGAVLDMACGAGRHAVDLARRGYQVVAFDLSLNMLARASDEAQERSAKLNFVQGDMREMTFVEQFDGVYCWNTSFGYFEEEKNALVIDRIHHALKGGGLLLLDVVNRDFLVQQSPSLAWFEGDGCICMDEMVVDFITSRMRVKRTMMLDDGRSRELEFSMRVYSLHELGKMLHDHGFKVCEVSGRIATPGVFFGRESPRTIVLAEKR